MNVIRKLYKVEYAHQLKNAFTSCCYETIHGHSGIIEIFLSSVELDKNDMVVDFGEVSSLIKNYLMDWFDHAIIIPSSFDREYIDCLKKYNKKVRVTDFNPTAESFAAQIFWNICRVVQPIIDIDKRVFRVLKVRFHETDTGYAEYQPEC
jgi:6-pyruvoyltetrahydropterin/6-carboxytetrahydropterin synthase